MSVPEGPEAASNDPRNPESGGTWMPQQNPAVPADERQFPVLGAVMEDYFATGKELRFLERYENFGEDSSEFAGLQDDLKAAIRKPERAAQEVNSALGTDLDAPTMRQQLAELLDQITSQGAFSEEAQAQAEAEEQATRPSVDQTLGYYFSRRVALPAALGPLSRYRVPLWAFLVSGFGLIGIGIGLGALPFPDWMQWLPTLFSGLGLIVVFLSAIAMLGLRNEVRKPEKEAKREQERAELEAKRAERKNRRGGLFK